MARSADFADRNHPGPPGADGPTVADGLERLGAAARGREGDRPKNEALACQGSVLATQQTDLIA